MTPLGPAIPEPLEVIKNLGEFFHRLTPPLYAVLDTAREGTILPLLEKSGCEYRTLYGSKLASIMDGLGPYLVALPQKSAFLLNLLEKGWGRSWGIFLTSSADFAAVRRHLRRLLAARLPDGKYALFRFFDPRVLRGYLPSCGAGQTAQFFGPIHAIYLESASGQELQLFGQLTQFTEEEPAGRHLLQHSLTLARGEQRCCK